MGAFRAFLQVFFSVLIMLPAQAEAETERPRVVLLSSSTAVDETLIGPMRQALEEAGYAVAGGYFRQVQSDFGYVNTDKERARQLIDALLDDSVDIVWFMRGGGGAMNLMPFLDARKADLRRVRPKTIVGFSDVTAIHSWLNEQLGWQTVHGVLAAFNRQMAGRTRSALNALEPLPWVPDLLLKRLEYDTVAPLNAIAQEGARGEMRGGNMTLVLAAVSTPWEPAYENKLIFLEDVGVSPRALDRSLQQLLHKKDLKVSGIVFGQFFALDASDAERLLYKRVISRFAERFDRPVYYFPFAGHGHRNRPLVLGRSARIRCPDAADYCTLVQPAADEPTAASTGGTAVPAGDDPRPAGEGREAGTPD